MPLRDHFRPPLSESRHWESFHAARAGYIVDQLNHGLLPRTYFAEEHIRFGTRVETDLTDCGFTTHPPDAPGVVWTPTAAPVTMPLPYPDHFAVHVWNQEGGMRLVGAVELVSPGNKD